MTERPAPYAGMADSSADQRVDIDVIRLYLAHWPMLVAALVLSNIGVMVAWRDHVSLYVRVAWCCTALLGYLGQSIVCSRMAQSASQAQAIQKWMPWLLLSLVVSGTQWALVPWLIRDGSTQALLFACLFNAALLFFLANSPRTPAMMYAAAVPIVLLDTVVLLEYEELVYVGAGFPVLSGLSVIYGLRGQAVLRKGIAARHLAEDLSRELEINQRRLVEVEHERTLLLERERLTRDMHDGLGSALVGSLVQVERGEVDPQRLASMLRECVDDLRSVIDSLEPIDHDLVALLSNLRHRLERRLEAAGVSLEWAMEDVPPLLWLGPPEALHVMRFVQEALSNVIKHAMATRIVVSTRVTGDDVEIRVVDDGKGFEPTAQSTGRGVPSFSRRATLLGGTTQVESGPGAGTRVVLHLPIVKVTS